MELIFGLALTLVGGITLFQTYAFWSSFRIYTGAVKRRSTDISHEYRLIPYDGVGLVTGLMEMGFVRLGETYTGMPGGKGGTAWIFTNSDNTIIAEVVVLSGIGAMAQFSTVFGDEATVEVSYPLGEDLDYHNYASRKASTLAQLQQIHAELMQTFTYEHGSPRRIKSIAEWLAWEVVYRENYVKKKLWPPTRRQLMNVLGAWGFLALLVVAYGVYVINFV
jgi:hypothetical protein